ncbi:MAG: hypothetical protein OEY56_08115 [Cyclobacteriaceae bacterium]|nr:hypothetical protein [Cyclobacteriaceae bacterium]
MKRTLMTMMWLGLWTGLQAVPTGGIENDTITIELDNDSRVVIYVRDKSGLEELEDFDLNRLVRDLNRTLAGEETFYIELDADLYQTDSLLVYRDGDLTATIRLAGFPFAFYREQGDAQDVPSDTGDKEDMRDFVRHHDVGKAGRRTSNDFNVELGTNNWLLDGTRFPNESNEDFSVKPWGSWYVGLENRNHTSITGPLFLDWGFGVNWYNWKMEDPSIRVAKGTSSVEFLPAPADVKPEKSKLTASYVNFNLVPMLDFSGSRRKVGPLGKVHHLRRYQNDGFRLGIGGYAGYRMSSHAKFTYSQNGNPEFDKVRGNFYLTNVRYGLRAQMGWKGADFFATYDLNDVFAAGHGPRLNAMSFGIIL